MPTMPLFVSSTFLDFHAERDAIRDVVVPGLNRDLQPLGCRVELIDLRAGVEGGGPTIVRGALSLLHLRRPFPVEPPLVPVRGYSDAAEFRRVRYPAARYRPVNRTRPARGVNVRGR